MAKKKEDEEVFKNVGYSINYEQHKKRERVKRYFEEIKKKNITEKEFELLVFDYMLDTIKSSKKSNTEPEP